MADNLDDEWWVDENNHDKSVSESEGKEKVKISKSKKEGKVSLDSEKKKKGAKRTAEVGDGKEPVKKKKKVSKNEKKKERKRITDESPETLTRPGMPEDVRALMTKVLKDKVKDGLLEDCLLDSENDFYPCNTEALAPKDYLASILTKWKQAIKKSFFMKKTGSPCLLIVTSSAIRAVELNRQIKDFLDSRCKVAKLFAKHLKVEEQVKFLSKTNCQVGIGTPGRLLLLIRQGALQLESLMTVCNV
ncbi:protein CMSS1-like isoform X2 [Physella acuta]|uniref:protein CMSS1-like isoform X2 n=1 Tax=Physella acuta TaxID=109671 RepID=UPI0027DDEDEF|nr:protein CMSS1-like isoform X2 [Physella acuta]